MRKCFSSRDRRDTQTLTQTNTGFFYLYGTHQEVDTTRLDRIGLHWMQETFCS